MTVVINGTTGYSGPVGVLGDLTTTGNTILGDQSTDTLNVANGNLVLNSSGNLGIGTASPSVKLDVYGSDPRVQSYNSSGPKNILLAGSTAGYTGMTTNHPLVFITNDTERMRLDTSGNLGIGTSSPSTKVEAAGNIKVSYASSGANASLISNNTSSTAGSMSQIIATNDASRALRIQYSSSGGAGGSALSGGFSGEVAQIFTDNAYPLSIGTSGVSWLNLSTTGNLGLGVTPSGSYKLEVAGSIAARFANPDTSGIVVQATTGTNAAAMRFINTGGSAYVGLDNSAGSRIGNAAYSLNMWHEGAYPLCFGNNNTERARIDSSGNFGLGVTPSAWGGPFKAFQLGTYGQHVAGQSNTADLKIGTNNYYNGSGYAYTISGFGASQFNVSSGSYQWSIAPSGTAGNAITFTQAMTLDASGNLLVGTTSTDPANNNAIVLNAPSSVIRFANTNTTGKQWTIGTSTPGIASAGDFLSVGRYSGSAWAEFTRIDSSGNLGIGVTSMSQKLQVNGKAIIGSYASTGAYGLYLRSDASSVHYNWQISTQNAVDGGFEIARSSATGGATFNSPSLVIDSSGNLLVGRTSTINNFKLVVGGTDAQLGLDGISAYAQINYSMNGVYKAQTYYAVSGDRFVTQCGSTGGVYLSNGATSWTALSDERTKDIIEPIVGGVSKLANLRTVIGKYKTDAEGTRRSFLIAQDVLNSFPEAVDTSDPDEMGVRYQDLTPVLVAAIKELKSELDSVKAELAALKGN